MAEVIPKAHRKALKTFLELDEATARVFLDVLNEVPPALLMSNIAEPVSAGSGVPTATVRRILLMLGSMSRARVAAGMTTADFARTICEAAWDEELATAPGQWHEPEERLAKALACSAVQITAKALQVVGDHQHVYCSARVLSDLRPVFEDESLAPKAIVVLHQLKLAYHENGDFSDSVELFVAMDRRDLVRLKETLERALQKDAELAKLAERLELPVLKGGE